MFYKIGWPADGKYAECYPVDAEYTSEGVSRCPSCNGAWEGRYWTHPRTLKITKSKYPDFIWTTPYPAVSERFKQLYEASGLTGILEFDPIENYILRKNAPEAPHYYTFKRFRSRMKIDHEKSKIKWLDAFTRYCPICHPVGKTFSEIYSLVLGEENYEGMDVFILNETGMGTYVSERFIEFVRENGLTNLAVYALNDMKTGIIIENEPKKRQKGTAGMRGKKRETDYKV